MPTIEIVSIGAKKLGLSAPDFSLAIIEENVLKSHRGLFNDFLSKHTGVIVHLGDLDFKEDQYAFFAGKLVDWENRPSSGEDGHLFRFLPEYAREVDTVLRAALSASPVQLACFLTDIQQGEEDAHHFAPKLSIEAFWQKHDACGLTFNRLYPVQVDR